MKFQVVMTVEIPDEDTILSEKPWTTTNLVSEYVSRISRQPQRFTIQTATRIVETQGVKDGFFAADDERMCSAKLRRRGFDGWECERPEEHTGQHAVPEMFAKAV